MTTLRKKIQQNLVDSIHHTVTFQYKYHIYNTQRPQVTYKILLYNASQFSILKLFYLKYILSHYYIYNFDQLVIDNGISDSTKEIRYSEKY